MLCRVSGAKSFRLKSAATILTATFLPVMSGGSADAQDASARLLPSSDLQSYFERTSPPASGGVGYPPMVGIRVRNLPLDSLFAGAAAEPAGIVQPLAVQNQFTILLDPTLSPKEAEALFAEYNLVPLADPANAALSRIDAVSVDASNALVGAAAAPPSVIASTAPRNDEAVAPCGTRE